MEIQLSFGFPEMSFASTATAAADLQCVTLPQRPAQSGGERAAEPHPHRVTARERQDDGMGRKARIARIGPPVPIFPSREGARGGPRQKRP